MASIIKVWETRWTQPVSGDMGFQYEVLYGSGRHGFYNWKQNLPITVLSFILADDVRCETKHIRQSDGRISKRTVYWKEGAK